MTSILSTTTFTPSELPELRYLTKGSISRGSYEDFILNSYRFPNNPERYYIYRTPQSLFERLEGRTLEEALEAGAVETASTLWELEAQLFQSFGSKKLKKLSNLMGWDFLGDSWWAFPNSTMKVYQKAPLRVSMVGDEIIAVNLFTEDYRVFAKWTKP